MALILKPLCEDMVQREQEKYRLAPKVNLLELVVNSYY